MMSSVQPRTWEQRWAELKKVESQIRLIGKKVQMQHQRFTRKRRILDKARQKTREQQAQKDGVYSLDNKTHVQFLEQLTHVDKNRVKAELEKPKYDNISDQVKGVFWFIIDKISEPGFHVPVMVLAITAGYTFKDEGKVVEQVVKTYARNGEGVHWKGFKNQQMPFPESGELIYNIPGQTSKYVLKRRSNRGSPTYYFTTVLFLSHVLCFHSTTATAKAYRKLLLHFVSFFNKVRVNLEYREAVIELEKDVESTDLSSCFIEPLDKHNTLRDMVAYKMGGKVEVCNHMGVADVESDSHAVEVKACGDWKHGLGQVIAYGHATKKRKLLALYCDQGDDCKRHNQDRLDILAKFGVESVHVNTLKLFE